MCEMFASAPVFSSPLWLSWEVYSAMSILPLVLHQDTLSMSYEGFVNPHESLGFTIVNANILPPFSISSGSVTWSADKGDFSINSVEASLESFSFPYYAGNYYYNCY